MSDILSSKQQTVYNEKNLSHFGSDDKNFANLNDMDHSPKPMDVADVNEAY